MGRRVGLIEDFIEQTNAGTIQIKKIEPKKEEPKKEEPKKENKKVK